MHMSEMRGTRDGQQQAIVIPVNAPGADLTEEISQ